PHLSSASSTHPAIPTLPLHDALPIYGWRWIDYADSPESEERDHMRRSIQAIERACGRRPVGWYTGRVSENTRRLVVEEGGFLYDSDSYADELPYWLEVAGRDHLVIPYVLDAN